MLTVAPLNLTSILGQFLKGVVSIFDGAILLFKYMMSRK
jgi:hypothetical protein